MPYNPHSYTPSKDAFNRSKKPSSKPISLKNHFQTVIKLLPYILIVKI